jgi:sorbitol-specific phosphotransferase system component IIBC
VEVAEMGEVLAAEEEAAAAVVGEEEVPVPDMAPRDGAHEEEENDEIEEEVPLDSDRWVQVQSLGQRCQLVLQEVREVLDQLLVLVLDKVAFVVLVLGLVRERGEELDQDHEQDLFVHMGLLAAVAD